MGKSRNPVRRLLGRILALGALISALTLAPIRSSGAQDVAPTWSLTGSPNTLRGGIATLLPDGKVLLVGGGSAELYDPSTGTWSLTGSLNVVRGVSSATLLGNGKVLVAGSDLDSSLPHANVAELYDPATGQWSLTGNPKLPRDAYTVTLLHNGKVLYAGGLSYRIIGGGLAAFAINTAEIYDPATGQWSLTGNLSTTRVGHAAALLQDGKVLVAGGCLDSECMFYSTNAEVYDPDTGAWSVTGGPIMPRDNHALTTLPNGNVLMTGGQGRPFPFTLNAAELYNPATGLWSGTGSLLKRRWEATATLLPNGKVLVAGGEFSYDNANPGQTEVFNSAELYDPATGTWNATASLNAARRYHSATLLNNGKVLVVGGVDQNNAHRSAELYITIASGTIVTVSAASYHLTGLSSEAIATSIGTDFATTTSSATSLQLPTELAGTTVRVRDSAGSERLAPLYFVSPNQVNYQIPTGTTAGAAAVTIRSGDGKTSTGIVLVNKVAPGLFAANADGQGVAAAYAVRVKADGSQSYEEVVQFDARQGRFVARPLDLGAEGEQVYLVLFGTGVRGRSSLSSVIATIGGAYGEVSFAGAQTEFVGVDQINVLLPRSLIGRGEVDVLLTVEAQMANPVRIQIK